MKDQKKTLSNLLQEYVNDQFDKRLRIKLDGDEYDIVIRQDQIPIIKNIIDKNRYILIKLNEYINEEFDDLLIRNSCGELDALKIDKKYLVKSDKNFRFFKDLLSNNDKLPETNKNEKLIKHRDKRFIHAISNFLSEVNNKIGKQDLEVIDLLKAD